MTTVRHVIGCMTGTSIDGIDVALCKLEGRGILNMRCTCLATHSADMPKVLSDSLRAFADKDAALTAKQLCELQRDFSMLHVIAIRSLMDKFNTENPGWVDQHGSEVIVSVHGQTVYHAPPLYSYQLFAAAPLAHELGLTVVCDLRAADVAAGGQGAPLTPVSDFVLFRDRRSSKDAVDVAASLPGNVGPRTVSEAVSTPETRIVVNLGGICNVTCILPQSQVPASCSAEEVVSRTVRGFDVCVCSQLLDAVARTRLNCAYDDNGANASAGTARDYVVAALSEKLRVQAKAGRSLGTQDSPADWIRSFDAVDSQDLAASAVEAVATCIVASFPLQAKVTTCSATATTNANATAATSTSTSTKVRVLLAGGSACNLALQRSILHHSKALDPAVIVQCTDHEDVGSAVGVLMRECCGWAVLGALCMDREAITLKQTTGVERAPVAGQWTYPP